MKYRGVQGRKQAAPGLGNATAATAAPLPSHAAAAVAATTAHAATSTTAAAATEQNVDAIPSAISGRAGTIPNNAYPNRPTPPLVTPPKLTSEEESTKVLNDIKERCWAEHRAFQIAENPRLAEKPSPDDWWHPNATALNWDSMYDGHDGPSKAYDEGHYTLLGWPTGPCSGGLVPETKDFNDIWTGRDERAMIQFTTVRLRQAGYHVQILPDWWYEDGDYDVCECKKRRKTDWDGGVTKEEWIF